MVGGQIIDINSKENQLSIDEINAMHILKQQIYLVFHASLEQ